VVLFLLKCGQAPLPKADFLEVRRALSVCVGRKRGPALRPGLDVASPDERRMLRETAAADADRLAERYGMTLGAPTGEPLVWRPFDQDDFAAIGDAIMPQLPQSTREALGRL
jgi:hypothetical protein